MMITNQQMMRWIGQAMVNHVEHASVDGNGDVGVEAILANNEEAKMILHLSNGQHFWFPVGEIDVQPEEPADN